MDKKITTVIGLLATFYTFPQIQASNFQHFQIVRSKKIVIDEDSILKTATADSIFICSQKCHLNSGCRYANYVELENQCQLIGEDDGNVQESEKGWVVLKKVKN